MTRPSTSFGDLGAIEAISIIMVLESSVQRLPAARFIFELRYREEGGLDSDGVKTDICLTSGTVFQVLSLESHLIARCVML